MEVKAIWLILAFSCMQQADAFDVSSINGVPENVVVSGSAFDGKIPFTELVYMGETFDVYDYTVVVANDCGWNTMLILKDEKTGKLWIGNYTKITATGTNEFMITADMPNVARQHSASE
jgi:hypothetical protein